MTRLPGCRLTGGVLPPVPPYGDVGHVHAILTPHRYLHCLCGHRIWEGTTTEGASVLVCHGCGRILDERRMA